MIKIYTFQFNNPVFLEYQYKTFKRFLKQEHQLICVNNADKQDDQAAILKKAQELGLAHWIPEDVDVRSNGYGHQAALNWTLRKLVASTNDVCIFLDHDMFAIREVILDFTYDFIGVAQGRGDTIKYLHPGFLVFNNTIRDRESIDLRGQQIDGHWCDSGGNFWHYWKSHPEIKVKGLSLVNVCAEHENVDIIPENLRDGYDLCKPFQILENFILHGLDGSNWGVASPDLFAKKKDRLYKVLDHYLSL